MKKITSLLIAAAVACGTFFTSCDVDDNEFVAPKDTWVYRASSKSNHSIEYKWTDSTGTEKSINFDVYANYSTKTDTLNFRNNGEAEVTEGMNIILVPDLSTDEAKSNITELVKDTTNIENICFFKAFGTTPDAEVDNSTESKPVNITSTAWTLIYNLNRFDKYTEKQFDQFTASLTLVDPSTNLNLKRILYNLIGEKLFAGN